MGLSTGVFTIKSESRERTSKMKRRVIIMASKIRDLLTKHKHKDKHKEANQNQWISQKDLIRIQKAAQTLTQQELEFAKQNKKLSNAEEELRYQVIEALYSDIPLTEEYKNQCIESFCKSTLSLDFIKSHVQRIREVTNKNNNKTVQPGTRTTSSKLIQKSTPEDNRNNFSYID